MLPIPAVLLPAAGRATRRRACSKEQIPGSRNGSGRHLAAKTIVPPAAKNPPMVGVRRSQRLLAGGEPESYLVRFPGLCESEPEGDDDGIEFDFRWERDEF